MFTVCAYLSNFQLPIIHRTTYFNFNKCHVFNLTNTKCRHLHCKSGVVIKVQKVVLFVNLSFVSLTVFPARTLPILSTLLKYCDRRNDSWGVEVKGRLRTCIDLVHEEGVYQRSSYSWIHRVGSLRPCKTLAVVFSVQKLLVRLMIVNIKRLRKCAKIWKKLMMYYTR